MQLRLCLWSSFVLSLVFHLHAAEAPAATNPEQTAYSRWKHGPPGDPHFFPIAVWLQAPRNAARFKAAGINVYVGLWNGPATDQLAELEAAGMRVICAQNKVGLANKENPTIIGWMHGDEPDNAQEIPGRKGYGPPIQPSRIVSEYEQLRSADPTRPILLNLGQGVAWDNYIGRGVRRNHPEDYAEYLKGCDIASFDIYPVVHDAPEIRGRLERVPQGVERLIQWSNGQKVVWNCIECSRISNPSTKATAEQIRSEVWMSLIHGSQGLIYFVHQFKPKFVEASLLDDAELLSGITAINRQIHDLAPVLNSPSLTNEVKVSATPAAGEIGKGSRWIAWMKKQHSQRTYLFTVNMLNQPVEASFEIENSTADAPVAALGEQRTVQLRNKQFKDSYGPYQVHLYSWPESR